MYNRRGFIKTLMKYVGGMGLLLGTLTAGVRAVFAKAKKIILPKGTRMDTLVGKNPADLDTRNLDPTPVEAFGTMGLSDHQVDLKHWRLEIDGLVEHPFKLGYAQVTEMPSVKKDVLLICPGFFAYHARWEGVSVAKLLEMAGVSPDATHVSFSGPKEGYEKTERFPIADVISGKVFLAYGVNGSALPKKPDFPCGLWRKTITEVTG